MSNSPNLSDFVSFFEAEPTRVDKDVGWACGANFDSSEEAIESSRSYQPEKAEFSF